MILLVDNADSFTFNLSHLIAEVAGESPMVVPMSESDALSLPQRVSSGEFSHVVISPGPGHPNNPKDFGASSRIIRAARGVPLLGVCLGHQGLAALRGGRVSAASPHHGIASTILHNGKGLFRGLPQRFQAVRYHSLEVHEPLPEGLVVDARTEDGTVMALHAEDQPHWGVQFHPESILTEYGAELVKNFLTLTQVPAIRYTAAESPPDLKAFLDTLNRNYPMVMALNMGSRFTTVAVGDDTSRTWNYRVGQGTTISSDIREERDILSLLNQELPRTLSNEMPADLPFRGGFLGYFGYEMKALTLGIGQGHPRLPDAFWLEPEWFGVIDHQEGRFHLGNLSVGTSCPHPFLSLMEQARRETVPELVSPGIQGTWGTSDQGYLAAIDRAKQALYRGDSYEVCLTDTYTSAGPSQGLDVWERMERTDYGGYLRIAEEDLEVVSASPELFLSVDHDRWIESRPIKGTAPRGRSQVEDEENVHALRNDRKTRAENLMIVDLLRNDLARVSRVGSVEVPDLMRVETSPHLHSLVSTIRARLAQGMTVIDAVRASFPGGSMTGAPKVRTVELLEQLEPAPRGVYSGSIGAIGFDGTAQFNIVIRTAVRHGRQWSVGAGGAIVVDSDPNAELAERNLKADAVIQALGGDMSDHT